MIGLTQSAILIYSPVWVDEFAPPGKATQWISLLQANVAIGIMLGVIILGLVGAGITERQKGAGRKKVAGLSW